MITKLGGPQNWNKTKSLILTHHRMYSRQLIESFGVAPLTDPFGCKKESNRESSKKQDSNSFKHLCSGGFHDSLVSEHMTDREMNLASASELVMLQTRVLQGILICAKDKKKSCLKYEVLSWATKQSKKLYLELKGRKSVYRYTKAMARMMHQEILGFIHLAEKIRPRTDVQ